jgi:1-acyl-sn-glycerol-3-phosphate acyltransferase
MTLKKGVPDRARSQMISEFFVRYSARMIFLLAFRFRCLGRENFPDDGGALICANHQSFLDPILVGAASDRRLNYIARKTLFRFKFFSRLISFWDAIPINQEGSGLGGIKESLKRLRRGEMVLIFPEGARTLDGEVDEFKPGFCSLARRGRVPIVPIGFDGAFDAWPRWRPAPLPAPVCMCIGEPLSCELMKSLTDEELIAELRQRILACHQRAREIRLR